MPPHKLGCYCIITLRAIDIGYTFLWICDRISSKARVFLREEIIRYSVSSSSFALFLHIKWISVLPPSIGIVIFPYPLLESVRNSLETYHCSFATTPPRPSVVVYCDIRYNLSSCPIFIGLLDFQNSVSKVLFVGSVTKGVWRHGSMWFSSFGHDEQFVWETDLVQTSEGKILAWRLYPGIGFWFRPAVFQRQDLTWNRFHAFSRGYFLAIRVLDPLW
jgi:hypothetical protein